LSIRIPPENHIGRNWLFPKFPAPLAPRPAIPRQIPTIRIDLPATAVKHRFRNEPMTNASPAAEIGEKKRLTYLSVLPCHINVTKDAKETRRHFIRMVNIFL
jgi:hypothetical protein